MNKIIYFLLLIGITLFASVTMLNWFDPIKEMSVLSITATGIFFLTVYAVLFYETITYREKFVKHIYTKGNMIFMILLTLVVLFSTFSIGHFKSMSLIVQLVTLIGACVAVFSTVLSITAVMMRKSFVLQQQYVSKWMILIYSILPIIGWSIYLLANFPGEMSPDSFAHWRQIHTFEFNNWHPVVYTWLMIILTKIWYSPAVVGLAQIIILSLIFGYGLYQFQKAGIHRILIYICNLFIACFPVYGAFSIVLWKDILYSAILLLLTILMFAVYSSRGQWLRKNMHLLLLGFTGLALMLMRSNGIPIYFALTIVMIVMFLPYWKQLLITLVAVIASYMIITGPLFTAFQVDNKDPNEALGIPTQQFARVVVENGDLSEEEEQYIYQMMPEDKWHQYYDPYITDPIKFSGDYNSDVVFDDVGYYAKTWASVSLKNPVIVTEAFLKQTSLVWQMNEPSDGYTNLNPGGIYHANTFNIEQEPVSNWLHDKMERMLNITEIHFKTLIWRPATYMFFLLLMGYIAARKTSWRAWLVTVPVILNIGTVTAGIPAQDFRYLLANSFAIAFLFLCALLTDRKQKERRA
ncbi:DUF6020 family protein [Gracilibacillus caseinilyticus]|uniref:DUF6020 family protein n=1 Tax=Gracilibacillus caseinilyticus TaxID=2932256 RepID=A0ABY4F169_9BACI|nr:DUF6020 family protein [Gracilibacillus caseinilyticus]UOQ50278.1 DUF6020 family protein [Gracilibacillus caseinilyticus]